MTTEEFVVNGYIVSPYTNSFGFEILSDPQPYNPANFLALTENQRKSRAF
jgi:hypothetical protein